MNKAKRDRIESLTKALLQKHDHFEALGMLNTHGLSLSEKERQFVAYELARAEVFEAEANLRKEQQSSE